MERDRDATETRPRRDREESDRVGRLDRATMVLTTVICVGGIAFLARFFLALSRPIRTGQVVRVRYAAGHEHQRYGFRVTAYPGPTRWSERKPASVRKSSRLFPGRAMLRKGIK